MSFDIRPHRAYTRSDLAQMLKPCGIDVDTFIARLEPKKPFRMIYWGQHLIDAMNRAAPAEEPAPSAEVAAMVEAAWPAGPKGSRKKAPVVVVKNKG